MRVELGCIALGFALLQQSAAVTGTVTMSGVPVKGALIHVASHDSSVTTDAKGTFTINGLAAGDDTLIVYHVGSEPERVPIKLADGVTSNAAVSVPTPSALDTIDIDAMRLKAAYARVGFDTRRASGGGASFFDQGEVEKRHVQYFSDLMRTTPGFRVTYSGSRRLILPSRGGKNCVTFFIDRMRWRQLRAGDIDDIVYPREIAGVEAYPGIAPAEYDGHGCASVVIWTKTHLGT
jgi:hypothetical protein